jgi:hypothetical protein
MLYAKVFPLYQVPEPSVDYPTVQDLFYHTHLFTIDDLWRWRRGIHLPGIGSSVAGVSLMTLKTGWRQLINGGRQMRYAPFPTRLSIEKGPRCL